MCRDSRLTYPSSAASAAGYLLVAKEVQLASEQASSMTQDMWYPRDLGLVNTFATKALSTASGYVAVYPDGSCYLSEVLHSLLEPEGMQIHERKINCNFKLQKFPFDVQHCNLTMETWLHNDAWLKIEHKAGAVIGLFDPNIDMDSQKEFAISDAGTQVITKLYDSGSYAQLLWKIELTRHTSFFITMVVLPSVALNLLVWLSTFIVCLTL